MRNEIEDIEIPETRKSKFRVTIQTLDPKPMSNKVYQIPIVKPWSKSKSKPLSQQTPKLNKSPPKKRKKEGFGPWADTRVTWLTLGNLGEPWGILVDLWEP